MGRTLSGDSANVINLPASTTGFTAGDYVYQSAAGYGVVPTGALTTGTFDPGALPTPVYSATATTSNELTYVEQLGGSMGSQVAAQLINGNIVYAYGTGDTVSYAGMVTVNFKIETTAGAVVVAETSTTMIILGPYQVSVIALPAGGFAIVCTTNSGGSYTFSARFYNADGTAATAVLGPTSAQTGNAIQNNRLKLQVLTDGSVIIGYVNNATFELRRVTTAGFDATFGTTGVITNLAGPGAFQFWDFVTDSSNSIHAISTNATSQLIIRRYNSVGVQQTTSTVSGLTGVGALAIAISSSGTIRGFVQDSTGVAVITWDGTTAALGTRIITSIATQSGGALGAFAQGSSGGYVVFYNAFLSGSSGTSGLFFQAFDSSNVALALETRVNSLISVNYRVQFVPIVVSGNTRIYSGIFQVNALGSTLNNMAVPMGIAFFAYSNTTYALVGAPTINYNYYSPIGPFALGAYARGGSTPGIAKFTIATTGTYSGTNPIGTTLIQKTFVDATSTASQLSLAPLSNGEFVAAWRSNSGNTFISKYSVNGVLQFGPVSVGINSSAHFVSVATFANGNIFVTYNDATTSTLRFRIYTPSLTVVTSGDIDTSVSIPTANPVACATFGDGDHIAVVFTDTAGTVHVRCVRSTGTVTARIGTGTTFTNNFQTQVIGLKSNAFAIATCPNDGTTTINGYFVRKTGVNSFLAGPFHTFGTAFSTLGVATRMSSSPIATPGNNAFYIGFDSSGTGYKIISMNPLSTSTSQLNASVTTGLFQISMGADFSATIGYTATGIPVIVANRASSLFLALSAFSMPPAGGANILTSGVTTTLATQGSSQNNRVTAIPHVGDAILIGFIDNNARPAFTSIVVLPSTVNVTLTTGVSFSFTGLNLTPESGFSLQGISMTGAASGSSGLVQTSGTAALNSNYSAATPATFFDFRNPLTSGANGMVVGRTVTMGNN